MKKFFKYTLWLPCLLLLSCDNWLDVKPQSQVTQETLFSTPAGFESALAGIYTALTSDNLYSYHLTMGKMDVLGQYYETIYDSYGGNYTDEQAYDYESGSVLSFTNNIWSELYACIANCNVLIEELEKNGKILTQARYRLIRGEAYALRAFCHLEVLRMFAPRYETGSEASIPYVEKFDMQTNQHLKQKEVYAKIIRDFNTAITDLKETDPILWKDYVVNNNWWWQLQGTDGEYDSFISYRSQRINYYAAHALLARAYMWMGDKENTLKAIDVVTKANLYPGENFTNEATFTDKDRLVQFEIIFGVSNPKIIESYKAYTKIVDWNYTGLLVIKDAEGIFEDAGDFRKLHSTGKNADGYTYSLKYAEGADSWNGGKVPVIRLAELLYYKAELLFDTHPEEAKKVIKDFMISRGVLASMNGISTKEEFISLIVADARREFVAEGQFFLFNKRLNRNLFSLQEEIDMTDFWVFPMPDTEKEFGQIN